MEIASQGYETIPRDPVKMVRLQDEIVGLVTFGSQQWPGRSSCLPECVCACECVYVCVCPRSPYSLPYKWPAGLQQNSLDPHSMPGEPSSEPEINTGNVITRVCQSQGRRSVNVLTSSVKADPDSIYPSETNIPGSLGDHLCLDHIRILHTVAREEMSQILTLF